MFQFLKYIQPTWYYRLASQSPAPLLADFKLLDESDSALITPDFSYTNDEAVRMDAAYQGLQRGVIPGKANCIQQHNIREINNVKDNYQFVRKYFATHWYFYTLAIRLFSLNNPFREIKSFIENYRIKRVNLFKDRPVFTDIRNNLNDNPLVSVIIPTLNRYEYLKDVLADLENQDYKNFEVLVCDQSDLFRHDFYKNWKLDIRVIRQDEKALWLARNRCIKESRGTMIALSEDDVRINPNWLNSHLQCVEYFGADASCGIFFPDGDKPGPSQAFYKLSDFFATGNTLVRKSVFLKTGLFDRQFEKQRMGDGEFGLRCILKGFKLIQNPLAYCIDIKAPVGGLRHMGSWDSIRPHKLFDARPVPSVMYFFRKYYGNVPSILYLFQNIPFTYIPYKWRKRKVLKVFMLVLILPILPFLLVSVYKSWSLSSDKLKQGAKIDILSLL